MNKNVDIKYMIQRIRDKRLILGESGPLNVVYDVDDVLNNLNDYVFDTLKLPKAKRFVIAENSDIYTEQQVEAIIQMYRDSETFKHLKFVPGARDICRIEKTGKALTWINSSNFTEDVAKVKLKDLVTNIPDLNPDRIILVIGTGNSKNAVSADIIIEDCFTNLNKYPDGCLKILIDKEHNQASEYDTTDAEKGITRVSSLIEANEIIKYVVDMW